jgi:hypothetical protein
MNITLVTYDQQVHFGIMACRRSVPQVQRFIDYLEDALVELEDAVGISSQPPAKQKAKPRAKAKPKAAAKKSAPRTKAKAKAKPKAKAKAKARSRAG